VDEIGYLECGCETYCDALRTLMEHKRLLGVVRKQDLPFLNELTHRPDVCVVDLDRPFGELGCVIMASGLGQRFGGNKLMADFCGKPLISWILDATDDLFARRVVVTRHRDVENLCREQNLEVVFHSLPHRSDTVQLGMEALGESLSGCLFCPGDQPLLSRETLQTLLLAANYQPERIWQLSCGETPVSPVFFPQRFFEELRHLPEGKGGNALAKRYPELLSFVPSSNPAEGIDADTPEDLERLTRIAEESTSFHKR
jgi:molybdenum cofactor cytidylyltransferase